MRTQHDNNIPSDAQKLLQPCRCFVTLTKILRTFDRRMWEPSNPICGKLKSYLVVLQHNTNKFLTYIVGSINCKKKDRKTEIKPDSQVGSLQQKFWRCFNRNDGNLQIPREKL